MAWPLLSTLQAAEPYVCRRCSLNLRQTAQRKSRLPVRWQSNAPRSSSGNVLKLLEERGYIKDVAGNRNALEKLLQSRQMGVYAGIDPTAPSLHLGHMLPFMILLWLYHHGHRVVSLIGGATAKVGDPSGRLKSRDETAEETQRNNMEAMEKQVQSIWRTAKLYGRRHGFVEQDTWRKDVWNNASWLEQLNILEFLRTIGKQARLGTMLGRDTVRNKMDKGDGMTFSEFTYPLLQGWDWWHMFKHHSIQLQVGGSDQYGNIVAGMDAVRNLAQTQGTECERAQWLAEDGRMKDELEPMGLTVPLLTTSGGEKFGKSAGNAVWLDTSMTSAFDLYGFLLRSADEDVERYLKLFTFVPLEEIAAVMEEHTADPGKRKAQHLLASEVLELVHGEHKAKATRKEHEALRAPSLASLLEHTPTTTTSSTEKQDPPTTDRLSLPAYSVLNTPWSHILYNAGLTKTKSEAARLIANGGVNVAVPKSGQDGESDTLAFTTVANLKSEDVENYVVQGLLVLRLGKWKVRVIEVKAE